MKPEIQVHADNGREFVTVWLSDKSAINPAIQTALLMKLIKNGELERTDPDHPLLYALLGVKNRHALSNAIKTGQRKILMRKRGSQRAALVNENITNGGLAMAERFLTTGRP